MPFRNFATITIAVAGLAVAGSASADRQGQTVSRYTYADVVDVKPLIRTVEVEIPVRECFEQPQREAPRRERSIGRTIAGGIIGGLIGSQIGDGSGRDVATVAGTLIGAASAGERERRQPQPARYCETRYEYETRERVEGFRVTYEYRGETFVTRTRTDPGDRIRVKVSVAPLVD
ncbi:MAG: glycine zipper 2TM domain-containing protein [Pseudomonadota bacterium]